MMAEPAGTAPRFWRSPPGQRFQGRYWRHREGRDNRPVLARLASLTGGVLLMLVGVALLILPGPGILLLAIGGALLASESLTVARVLDWAEVDARAGVDAVRRWWRRRRNRTR